MKEDGKELSLRCSEIKSIQTPYKYIENIPLEEDRELLMTLASDGKVKLFNHVTINPGESQSAYGGTYTPNRAPTIVFAIIKDGKVTEIKKKDFKSTLAELFVDQGSIVDKVNDKKFRLDDIEAIVNEYNEIHRVLALKRQITAKVIDSQTKKPVRDVKVTIGGTDITTVTNALGFFQITIDTVDVLILEGNDYKPSQIKVPKVNAFQIPIEKISSDK